MLRLSAPTHTMFYISAALAIISVVLRALVVTGIATPFHTGGYVSMLLAYLMLVVGVMRKGV
jgi:hypothetical protein